MAESKPTKLQMAKEVQHLIAAAQDMSAVMDLDPPIKTDYLIDLKNKTVTVAHLQSVITNLQADIKAVAVEIEPGDKFDQETHGVLADLKVKVPRPSPKEEVVEDEIEPTPSPPMVEETGEVVEEEKPIKKVKKNAAGTTDKIKKQRYSRVDSILDAILDLSINENKKMLAVKANDLYIENGGKDNVKETLFVLGYCIATINGAREKGIV